MSEMFTFSPEYTRLHESIRGLIDQLNAIPNTAKKAAARQNLQNAINDGNAELNKMLVVVNCDEVARTFVSELRKRAAAARQTIQEKIQKAAADFTPVYRLGWIYSDLIEHEAYLKMFNWIDYRMQQFNPVNDLGYNGVSYNDLKVILDEFFVWVRHEGMGCLGQTSSTNQSHNEYNRISAHIFLQVSAREGFTDTNFIERFYRITTAFQVCFLENTDVRVQID